MPFLHLLKTCVDNISTITTHFSLWYRHIQNALGAMPITEMLFSVALFRRVSCRCCKAFRIQLQWELQINKAPRPSPSITKSLQGQALLNYVTISFAALPKTACHKPIQFKVTQAHGWNGTHTSHKARQAHILDHALQKNRAEQYRTLVIMRIQARGITSASHHFSLAKQRCLLSLLGAKVIPR